MVRAAEARTSTKVSSISRMIMRIIFAGSSALSSRSVILAATISRVREKMPMGKSSLLESKGRAGLDSGLARGEAMRISSPAFTWSLTGFSLRTRAVSRAGRAQRHRRDPRLAGLACAGRADGGADRQGGKDEGADQ